MKNNKNNKFNYLGLFSLRNFNYLGLFSLRNTRLFSSSYCKSSLPDNKSINPSVVALVKYDDADVDKVKFFTDNRDKSGVYRWVNKKNGKTYVGSSINLSVRFYTYYSLAYLAKSNRPVDRALLKYGFSNFSLEILEYCETDLLLEREQYYMDYLKPEYNIVEKAGSTLGYKHTPESLAKMRDFVISEEAKAKKALSTANAAAANRIPILVEDTETGEKREFISLVEAANEIGVSRAAVSQAFLGKRLLKKRYFITRKT